MGRQDNTLTIDQQKMLQGVIGNEYCDNIFGQALTEHSDRLELKKITCKGKKEQEWIDKFWQKSKWDKLQQRTHRYAIRDGNHVLAVSYDYDNKNIVIQHEKWWNGSNGIFIGYDSFGRMLYAVKEWSTPNGRRRTVYYEGFIERYVSERSGKWFAYLRPSDTLMEGLDHFTPGRQDSEEAIPIPYIDAKGDPLHIPFIHFANPGDEYDNHGTSMFEGGSTGAQDQINDVQYDILAAGRMTGYQRTWSKGYKLEKIGNITVKPKTGPGVHYHSENPLAEWGVLEAGSIEGLLSILRSKIESFCRATGTPLFSITGNFPSGEAIYKLEQPIRGRTKARQKSFAPAWIEVMHRCMELANVIDREGLDEESMLTAIYTDAGDRDPLSVEMSNLSFWQAALAATQCGLPLAVYLRVQGWGEEELKGMSLDIEAEIKRREEELLEQETDGNNTLPGTRQKGKGGEATAPNNSRTSNTATKGAKTQSRRVE